MTTGLGIYDSCTARNFSAKSIAIHNVNVSLSLSFSLELACFVPEKKVFVHI